jgi:hypothetical protein
LQLRRNPCTVKRFGADKAAFKREIEDDSPRLFAFEEPPSELRAVSAVGNEAAQAEKFVIPQHIRVPESSVIRSLFEADGERDASSREDQDISSDSMGKRLEGCSVAVSWSHFSPAIRHQHRVA